MDFLSKLYAKVWYHTEFWLPPKERRPFTFILRDFYHTYPFVVLLFIGAGFYAIGNWGWHISVGGFFIALALTFTGIILGHLYWSSPWRKGEQEEPEYTEPEDENK